VYKNDVQKTNKNHILTGGNNNFKAYRTGSPLPKAHNTLPVYPDSEQN